MKKIEIGYTKPQIIQLKHLEESNQFPFSQEDIENQYKPFEIENLQQYQPIYSLFFDMTLKNYNSIQFNHRYHIKDMTTVIDSESNIPEKKPVFIKYSPLYDPIKYMIGKYHYTENNDIVLPSPMFSQEQKSEDIVDKSFEIITNKLESIHNASYVDGFFCFLSSKLLHSYGCKHAMDYYGSYLGIQKQFKMNIVDDYDYLTNSTFFNHHLNKLFKTTYQDFIHSHLNKNSRANRNKINISEQTIVIEQDREPAELLEIQELTSSETDVVEFAIELEDIYEQPKPDCDQVSVNSSDSDNNYSSEEEDGHGSDNENEHDSEIEDGSEMEDDGSDSEATELSDETEDIFAYIKNFPVQMICLEKCDGTLDELFDSGKIDEKRGASALFQVVITLLIYQKVFKFTHNDLHTNNIMYVNTSIPFLYYKYQNIKYKVPTFGKIFKIIDFGRSIYHFQGKRFCSDSFGPGGDAATQYNTEPYFNDKKPRIEPNYSFDLCRLGTSLFDFVFDIDDPNYDKKMNPLQSTILRWCTDDSGKNVLYKHNGEDRYPNFKLYKMISRNVHKHTPHCQFEFAFFKQFRFMGKPVKNMNIVNIDDLPNCM